MGLRSLARRSLFAALALVVLMITACSGRGSAANTGWTAVTATEDTVYAALAAGTLVAVDAGTGQQIWQYPPQTESGGGLSSLFSRSSDGPDPLGPVYGAPVVLGDLLLVSSLDDQVHAFDRNTGVEAWSFQVGGDIVGGVTVYDGVAYFGSSDHRVYALDLDSQEPVWAEPFETGNWVWCEPVIVEDTVYVSSVDHKVYAIDRLTGDELWHYETDSALPGGVAVAEGRVFAGSLDNNVYALSADSGELLWKRSVGAWIMGQPLAVDGYVYVASSDGKLHGLSAVDGSPRWDAVSVESPVRAGPKLLNGAIAVVTQAAELWQIDVETGSPLRLYPDVGEPGQSDGTVGQILSEPAIVGDIVYLGTTAGYIFAIDTQAELQPEIWIYSAE